MIRIIFTVCLFCFALSCANAQGLFVSNEVREQLGKAQTAYEQGKFGDGLAVTETTLRRPRLNDYEKALIWQMQGYLYAGDNDITRAVDAFEKSLQSNALDEAIALGLRYNLGQLLLSGERYRDALEQLLLWKSKAKDINSENRILIATTYYFSNDYANAQRELEVALNSENNWKKYWIDLALAVYAENQANRKAISVLEHALKLFPADENLWRQLANFYRLEKQDKAAIAALQTAYDFGRLTDAETVSLARLYFYLDAPYKGADILRDALEHKRVAHNAEHYALLGECWLGAREYARAASAFGDAAKISGQGKFYVRQGEIHIDQENWLDAATAFEHALKSEQLENTYRVWLLLGIAQYELHQHDSAWHAFTTALKDKEYTKQAAQWLALLESER